MKHKWLQKNNNSNLIIFFNGWGMDSNPFHLLKAEKNDVVSFYDYKKLDFEENIMQELYNYDEISVISWSMGVWVAGWFSVKTDIKIKNKIAINGTLNPICDRYGIPSQIYDLTLNTLNDQTIKTFYQNMFTDESLFENFMTNHPRRSADEQKEELIALKKHINKLSFNETDAFDKVIIGKFDKIIPAKNQLRFWKHAGKTEPKILEAPHYLFNLFDSWEHILDYE